MEITREHWYIAFISWFALVPMGFLIMYRSFPVGDVNWLNLSLLFVGLVVTMILPFRLPDVTLSLERWITFAVFLQYGVFAEWLFTQLAMIILLVGGKSAFPRAFRLIVNSVIFTMISMVSGAVFHLFGGEVGMTGFKEVVWFGLLYAVLYTFTNTLLLKFFFKLISHPYALFRKVAIWDYAATMIVFPFSVAMYFLSGFFGSKAILLIGIPFVLIILIARGMVQSDHLGQQLSAAGKIGRDLAGRLVFEEVIQTFLVTLKDVVPFEHGYILDWRRQDHLVLLMGSENGVLSKRTTAFTLNPKWTADGGLNQEATKVYRTRKEVELFTNISFSQGVECVMIAPIRRDGKTEGFLILGSTKKNVFHQLDMKIVDILTGYLAISLVKARLYEQTIEKSERCGLTKLYNYRHLDARLEQAVSRLRTGEISNLSVIILDIDHFKSINDTYGHQSGNDLLIALATILQTYLFPGSTVARYGGEEFVFVLPEISEVDAMGLAEKLRREVASTAFRIVSDLSETRETLDVRMTISLGVATASKDIEDANGLLRNADRALYMGGKRAGRNRVGVYGYEQMEMV